MKNKNLKLSSLSIKSFVTSIKNKQSETVKGGAAPIDDTSDSVVTCDTNNNCTKYYPCEQQERRRDKEL